MAIGAPAGGLVRLLDFDPELGRTLAGAEREDAGRRAVVRSASVPVGPWDPAPLAHRCAYGLLVLDGLLSREATLTGTVAMQLVGRGDLISPLGVDVDGIVAVRARWTALAPATVALLDESFVAVVRRWPELAAALLARVGQQAERAAAHRAVAQLPRVEDRIRALLWILAERWGRVTPGGMVVPIHLTHDALGRLIGAKRPTVSLAVKALGEAGSVRRREDGAWLLAEPWREPAPAPRLSRRPTPAR